MAKASVTIRVDCPVLDAAIERIASATLTDEQEQRLAEMLDDPTRAVRVERVGKFDVVLYPSDELLELCREVEW